MTDAEIKKALECCADELHWCTTCPYFLLDKENDLCREDLCDDALYLINRQQAEIERLKNDCFCIANERDAIADCLDTAVAEAKAEAIKEFAERLKELKLPCDFEECGLYSCVDVVDIDNLVKEMAGDAE